jgi:hypothetical protein
MSYGLEKIISSLLGEAKNEAGIINEAPTNGLYRYPPATVPQGRVLSYRY